LPNPEDKIKLAFDRQGNYRICVEGFLDEKWQERLDCSSIMTTRQKDDKWVTELIGNMRDQAKLIGLVNTLYELHLTLLSVEYLNGD
jgi:hypothetical protein